MCSFLYDINARLGLLLFPLLWLAPHAAQAEEAQPLALEQAVQMLKQQNPLVAVKRKYADALAQKPEQYASLPAPVLSMGAMNFPTDTFSSRQEAMTQLTLGITQSLPFPGKLDLQAESASYQAKAALDDVDELLLQLISRVKASWWQLFYLDRALEAVGHNQQLLRQLIQVAESKYKVGKGLQQDVLLAQLELSKLLDMQLQLDAERQLEMTRLNTLLGRDVSVPLALPKQVSESLTAIADAEALMARALNNRPRLAKAQKLIDSARLQLTLAEKENYPDFTLGASYGYRASDAQSGMDRADLATVSLSMTLPFFTGDKQDAHFVQRQAQLMAQEFAYQDAGNEVRSEISQAVTRYQRSKKQAALFKSGIIPQASQTVASMLAAYQVNKVDFLNLMQAQVTLYNYETQYWKVFAEAKQAMASLDAAVGEDVFDE